MAVVVESANRAASSAAVWELCSGREVRENESSGVAMGGSETVEWLRVVGSNK